MYLHGWASSAQSAKGAVLARSFAASGVHLHLPSLNRPSFERLTYTGALDAVREAADAEPSARWDVVGSSMGGFIAARWAELHPERVNRLVLLCPGFDLLERLPIVFRDDALLDKWERQGSFEPGYGPDGPRSRVSWDFVADARRHPGRPRLRHPTLILHGVADDVIPIGSSRRAVAECESAELIQLVELDDGHDLVASSETIVRMTRDWLQLPPAR